MKCDEIVSSDAIRPAPGLSDRILWLIIIASAIVKSALAVAVASSPLVLDESEYAGIARVLAEHGSYSGTFRPPLYPAFLAAFFALGGGLLAVRITQVVLSSISVALVYRIAGRTFGRSAARVAAILFAFDPVLVMFTHRVWSETLFIFFLLIALDILTWTALQRRRWPWLVVGILFGLAGLTRPMVLTFVPFLLPWAIVQHARRASNEGTLAVTTAFTRRQPWANGVLSFALIAIGCALPVIPWTVRNAYATGAFVLVDSNGPFNLLVGNEPAAAFVDKDDFWSMRYGAINGVPYRARLARDVSQAQHAAVEKAMADIRAAPARFVHKSIWEAQHLWTLDSFLLRHLRNGWYGDHMSRGAIAALTIVSVGYFAILVIAGLTGIAAEPPTPLRGLVILLLVHSALLFGLTYSLSRYLLPLHPLLAMTASGFLVDARHRLRSLWGCRGSVRRVVLLAFVLTAIVWQWQRDVPLMKDMIDSGGVNHRFRMERPVRVPAPRQSWPRQ